MFLQQPLLLLLILLVSLSVPVTVVGKPTAQVKTIINRVENLNPKGQTLVLPYAFSAESTGLVIGVGGMRKGFHQEQMSVGGLGFVGEESYGIFGGFWDYRFPPSQRLFLSVSGMLGYYPEHRAYALPREIPLPAGVPRPGANNSSEDVFLESAGDSNWLDIKLEYALPIGATRDEGMISYQLENGLVVSPTTEVPGWNPLENGATVLALRQYNRYQSYETDLKDYDGEAHAFELGLLYDNTDYPLNPSQGSSQYIAYHNNPSWTGTEESWDFIELEASKYFSLGSSDYARQRIIALNAWTGYSPSWNSEVNANGGEQISDAAPFLEGANLGGYYRMRGYRDSRFHDKAAVYATAEYRYTLDYNPIKNVQWLRFLNLDWFQLVGFVEGGRVAPQYKTDTLFKDWKSDVGFGLRALTAGIIVRADIAWSDEGTNFWVMVGHPF